MSSLGAVVTSDLPILAERAMYMLSNGTFGGGSASSGSPAVDAVVFRRRRDRAVLPRLPVDGEPGPTPATATVTYHISDGTTASKDYSVPARAAARSTSTAKPRTPALAPLARACVVHRHLDAADPRRRAMWWSTWPWYEGHAAPGSIDEGRGLGVPEGRHGGPMQQTYVLVGNTTATAPARCGCR